MLDSITESHRRGRCYYRILDGFKVSNRQGLNCYFLTFTSSMESPKFAYKTKGKIHIFHKGKEYKLPFIYQIKGIMSSFDKLIKFLRRKYGYIEYCGIRTSEGKPGQVLHMIIRSKFRLDIQIIREKWFLYHKAVQLFIVRCYSTGGRLASYLTRYLSNQRHFERFFMSQSWIFKGFHKKFVGFIREHGYVNGILKYNFYLDTKLDLIPIKETKLIG